MPLTTSTQDLLDASLAVAKIKVLGIDLLKNDAEARLLMAVTQAYGSDGCGFIYVSPSRARSTRRPPDIVLCHPMTGLLLIESKGHGISDIEGIEAGHMIVRYENRPVDIKDQVEDQLYEITRDLTKLDAKPLINWMVAFPNISQDEWRERGYDKAFPCSQLLFKDQVDDPSRLEKRVRSLVLESLSRSGKTQILSDEHATSIQRVFGNSALINECREVRPQIERQRLGAQIDAFVTQDKYLSDEQRQLMRMNIGGSPRVIRGVAGSGKSIVLAELVARYLHRQLPLFDSLALPEADISVAVTCFNRTLVEFLKRKIQGAYHVQTLSEDIPSSVLLITHLNQLMWILCKQRGWPLTFVPVGEMKDSSQRAQAYREQIAAFARRDPDQYHSLCFDALFIDEGQDFEPEEYRLLLDLIKPHPKTGEKTLIIFYDDAQNLFGKPRPVWREVGINYS
jgi:superfamily I DNA and RNA helicase